MKTEVAALSGRGVFWLGGGLIVPLPIGGGHNWNVEVGYNKWIWGRSARTYQEPYISIGHAR